MPLERNDTGTKADFLGDHWVNRGFEFVAVDEVQLAGDRERGHVFTDRILHARGQFETMLMGAETAGPLLRQLLPEARSKHANVCRNRPIPDRAS